jgi:UDP:flavonoid glycosyltransferase YjiC (YdhE family)
MPASRCILKSLSSFGLDSNGPAARRTHVKRADTDTWWGLSRIVRMRVLLAWEMGGAYGHVMRYAALRRELVVRGHDVTLALRDLTHVHTTFGDADVPVLQAPVFMGEVAGLPEPTGLAETLLRQGFLHPPVLASLCRAWRRLVALTRPDVIVLDNAPTALLATRGLGVPRVQFGDGFSTPPATEPLPPYRHWKPEPMRLADAERHALAGANAALALLGEPPLPRLAALFETEATMLAAYPAFDHYGARDPGLYVGPMAEVDGGVAPDWPAVDGPRVFAYVKPLSRDFDAVLDALAALPVSVVVHAPGVSPKRRMRHLAANIRFSEPPVRLRDVVREAQFGICHAGVNTVQALVGAGIPLLLLPEHIEQMMTARRVAQAGAAITVDFEKPPPAFRTLLRRLFAEPAFTAAARALAQQCAGDEPGQRSARVCEALEALAARGAEPSAPTCGSTRM